MVARDFQTLTRRRAERARALSGRYPASREALAFLAEVAEFQAGVDPASPLDSLPALVELVRAAGPERLIEAARDLDPETCREAMDALLAGEEPAGPSAFFVRTLLQPARYGDPSCRHRPQAGLLKTLGHGQALWLSCAFCFHQWEVPRNRCCACGQADAKKLAYYRAEEIPHIQVMTCDDCRQYIHLIDMAQEPRAVADIDEVAALPLDVWALERGLTKIHPNLAGI